MRGIFIIFFILLSWPAYGDSPSPIIMGNKTPYNYDEIDRNSKNSISATKTLSSRGGSNFITIEGFFSEKDLKDKSERMKNKYYRELVEEYELTDAERKIIEAAPQYYKGEFENGKRKDLHKIVTLGKKEYDGENLRFFDEADIDKDGKNDYIMGIEYYWRERKDKTAHVMIFNSQGELIWRDLTAPAFYACVAGDLNKDGNLEVMCRQDKDQFIFYDFK